MIRQSSARITSLNRNQFPPSPEHNTLKLRGPHYPVHLAPELRPQDQPHKLARKCPAGVQVERRPVVEYPRHSRKRHTLRSRRRRFASNRMASYKLGMPHPAGRLPSNPEAEIDCFPARHEDLEGDKLKRGHALDPPRPDDEPQRSEGFMGGAREWGFQVALEGSLSSSIGHRGGEGQLLVVAPVVCGQALLCTAVAAACNFSRNTRSSRYSSYCCDLT